MAGRTAERGLSRHVGTLAMSDQWQDTFDRFARWIERQVGSPITFLFAVAVIAVWTITGPMFVWSDTWQLVINTGTGIVTFLMVFLIQSTQSRDTRALHLKLDELIRATTQLGILS